MINFKKKKNLDLQKIYCFIGNEYMKNGNVYIEFLEVINSN